MEKALICQELASLFSVLAHGDRIRIVEELRHTEHNVKTLSEILDLSSSRISQHLSLLKSHRLLVERREGRMHFYRLAKPSLATWLLGGLEFLETEMPGVENIHSAVSKIREVWGDSGSRGERAKAPSEESATGDTSNLVG